MELKHGYYHLIAILTVAIWGLTFISTKVLINHGLTPQEIFFYRFLIAYLGIWVISPKRLFTNNFRHHPGVECIVYHLHGSLADYYPFPTFL